ncbi:MAG: SDR family oxidoreductase [Dehalococcoidia bacterium]|nr:SDR family oxidoreductase [Dehalococcoidia bacterium]
MVTPRPEMPAGAVDLSGRKAMVVGVETPAGAAIALAYARAGADVALCALRADEGVVTAKRIQKQIQALGRGSSVYVMDVLLGRNVQVTTRQVTKELGGLDIVAGCSHRLLARPLAQTTDVELQQVLALNFNAQFFLARSAAGELVRQGRGGSILLVTRALDERGIAGGAAAYSAAHAAVHALVRALAQELAPQQVAINALALDWEAAPAGGHDEQAAHAVGSAPAERPGAADAVGPLAVRLSRGGAGAVSGQVVAADGDTLPRG